MSITQDQHMKIVRDAILKSVKQEIEKTIDAEIKETVERINTRIRNTTDILALRILEYYNIYRDGHDVVIRVTKEPTDQKTKT